MLVNKFKYMTIKKTITYSSIFISSLCLTAASLNKVNKYKKQKNLIYYLNLSLFSASGLLTLRIVFGTILNKNMFCSTFLKSGFNNSLVVYFQ